MFYFGYRIYAYEMALLLALVALVPVIAITKGVEQARGRLPASIYWLLLYVSAHLLVSGFLCVNDGTGGVGHVLRVYVRALWPLVFAIAFFQFGSTRFAKHVLMWMYVACAMRVGLGLIGYYSPQFLYIPFVNLILPGAHTGGLDLRASSLLLVSLALCYTRLTRSRIMIFLHQSVIVLSGVLILLGGSRAGAAVFCGILLLWPLFHRNIVLLSVLLVCLLTTLIVLTSFPSVTRHLPMRVQRTLSAGIVGGPEREIHRITAGSDRWHYDLIRRGFAKWLASPQSFFLGNRVHPFDEAFHGMSATTGQRRQVATSMGGYESGLLSILAVLGTLAAVLYIHLFYNLLRPVVPALLRHGVDSPASAFYFLAVAGITIWIVFCWIRGNVPSGELMMAAIASALWRDEQRQPLEKDGPANDSPR